MALTLFLLALFTLQTPQHQHGGSDAKPATLMPGMGRLSHPIQTASADAQKFFDQGLTLVYAFNHDEAMRSFRRAAELDPASPMPHWGIALALGPNINLDVDPERELAAFDEAQRAKALAVNAPPNERAYVDALLTRYSNDPKADLKTLAVAYKDAMAGVVRQYPNDLDAAALYAESLMDLHPWQLWTANGAPTEGTEEIVRVLESILKRDPMHIGANHYYIHAVEASKTPDRALASARRLDTLVPAAGHLVHMPAHIYMRTGDYKNAVTANAKAAEIDRKYIAETNAGGVYPLMYYTHNLDFLASAAMMTGHFEKASAAADLLVSSVMPAIGDMPMVEPFGAKTLYVLLRFARYDDVMRFAQPDPKHVLLTTLWHFGRGVAQASRGNAADAAREWDAYKAAQAAVPPDMDWGYNKARDMFAVADAVFEARLARARRDAAAEIDAWRTAALAEDALSYNEPPDWFYPTRESLGAALMRAKRYADAEEVFRADLTRNPRNGRSLFGLWQSLLMQKKASASAAEKEFQQAWKNADVQLTLESF